MIEEEYNPISNFVIDQLKTALVNRISVITMKYTNTDKMFTMLEDLRWLGLQRNIMAIWGDSKRLSEFLMDENFSDTRLDFITDVTIMLKVRLGAKGWSRLMEDVVGSMRLWDSNANRENIIFSNINVSKLSPSEDIIRANHLLVPIIIYGVLDDTLLTIDMYINELREKLEESRSPRTNRVLRS